MTKDWDTVYAAATAPGDAAEVLRDNMHLLPTTGDALDVACGLGANALLLASHGLQVEAWDTSHAATTRLQSFALEQGLSINALTRDVATLAQSTRCWDVIVVAHFLDRRLCALLPSLLKPGGLLFYQTFTRAGLRQGGPSNPDFLLAENELLNLFADLRILYFRDEGSAGNPLLGNRGKSFLVAQRPLT